MAPKKGDKLNKPDFTIGCSVQTRKSKPTRRIYSVKKTELQVRRRNNTAKGSKDSGLSQGVPTSTMFYPPCPYYPAPINEWNPALQCPIYGLPLPVIVNPEVSTHIICPYSQIVLSPVTNEFPVSPLVPVTNEFPLLTNDASPIGTPNELSVYCEPVINLPYGYTNLGICNEAFLETPSPDATEVQLSNDFIAPLTPISNEYTPLITLGYDFSLTATPMSDVFSTIQNIQVQHEFISTCSTEISPLSSCSYESYENYDCELPIVDEPVEEITDYYHFVKNQLEYYLSLPKDLFPTASMMTIDPNLIIDEFCKVSNLEDNSWILDLEFGVPKTPVTRRVAAYNVKLNSINCKNTPEAIHPGFERCDKDLKRILMFYYDCVISNWYRGYMAISSDGSVENFQTWLLLPMQVLGMCWP